MNIGFNKPYLTGKELNYISDAVSREKISGDGFYTRQCQRFFETQYGFRKALLTTSCTDALEMAALLLNIAPGDEIIVPSYTFVSSANPFVLRGAKIVFADSAVANPNLDTTTIRALITPKTKTIVVVHYAGVACNMQEIMALAAEFNLFVVEDAAQAIDSFYDGQPLGSIGHLGCFSFHETKNISCGEGGMLVINDEQFKARAEIIWEKGTNRSAFFRGEVDKYGWIDVGSSFLPSELNAAFLFAQLEKLSEIQEKRKQLWNYYHQKFASLQIPDLKLPTLPSYATNNAHMYYLVCPDLETRTELLAALKDAGIQAIFHYLPLHASPFYKEKHDGRELRNSHHYADCLLRLPFYFELTREEQDYIIHQVATFFQNRSLQTMQPASLAS